jgi:hypothetical protein
LQQMQHMYLEIFAHSVEHAGLIPQGLLHCKSMVEVVEVQRDPYIDAVNQAITSSSSSRSARAASIPRSGDGHHSRKRTCRVQRR